MELPIFKYHTDPIRTGAIEKTDDECECCEASRGYKATSTIYAVVKVKTICPWCIADGSAAVKFNGSFSDSYPLLADGIDQNIVKEVCERTPSFISWQQERWLSHCNDACEFHGDATKADLESLSGDALKEFLSIEYIKEDIWPNILASYEKGSDLAIYKFKCRVCEVNRFYSDCT